jgi:hypothetical protein
LGSTVYFAGLATGDSALGLDPAISNRLMITTYRLWFAVAAWGPARRASCGPSFEASLREGGWTGLEMRHG